MFCSIGSTPAGESHAHHMARTQKLLGVQMKADQDIHIYISSRCAEALSSMPHKALLQVDTTPGHP